MSEQQELAKDVAGLAVVAMSLATQAPILAAVVPLVGLVENIRARWLREPSQVSTQAINAVLQGMSKARIPAAQIMSARAAMRNIPPAAELTKEELVAATKAAEGLESALVRLLLSRLPDGTDYNTRSLIETLLHAGVKACIGLEDFNNILSQELLLELSRSGFRLEQGQDRIENKIETLRAEQGSFAEALNNASALHISDLRNLALYYKMDQWRHADRGALISFLLNKAEELEKLQQVIAGLERNDDRYRSLLFDAREALKHGNFTSARAAINEARQRIKQHDMLPVLERDASFAELEADTALADMEPWEAFSLLSEAADSFGQIDALKPPRQRLQYAARLFQHGSRYGGAGLQLASQMLRDAQDKVANETDKWLQASIQNNLSSALCAEAMQVAGKARVNLLAEAITSSRAALSVFTQKITPKEWADSQNNLGIVLAEQGMRTSGNGGDLILEEAAAAFIAALRVSTRDLDPVRWADIQGNLGVVRSIQGTRSPEYLANELISKAVDAFELELQVRDEEKAPLKWANAQSNLGNALLALGCYTDSDEAIQILKRACGACNSAIRVRSEDEYPVQWAASQNNLGVVLIHLGDRTPGEPGVGLLADAIIAFDAALRVRTKHAHALQRAETHENIALAEFKRAARSGCRDPRWHLEAALVHVNSALEVYDPQHLGQNYAKASYLRHNIIDEIRKLG